MNNNDKDKFNRTSDISSSDSDIFSISSDESFFEGIEEIDNLKNFVPTHEENENIKLQEVLSITEKLMTTYDREEILNIIVEKSIDITGAERGYLILVDEKGELEIVCAKDMDSETPEDSMKEISTTVLNKVIGDKESIIIKDALKDEEYEVKRSIINLRLKAIMCVPMIKEDRVLGIIYVENRTIQGIFTNNSADILKFFGNQCAIALENLDLIQQNQQYADNLEKQVEERTIELQHEKGYTENIIENIGELLITVGDDYKMLRINKALNDILGLDTSEYLNKPISELYSSQSAFEIEKAIDEKKNKYNISCFLESNEGEKIHFSATISHIIEDDRVVSSVIINKDMREVEKYEKERLGRMELESITKAAVTANDQINTPLGVIIGRATILESLIKGDESAKKNLSIIKDQTFRIKETLNEMKKITKIKEKDYKLDGVKMIDLSTDETK